MNGLVSRGSTTVIEMMKKILDEGYVKLIETWGSDERFIESARMSTDKGFNGWKPAHKCNVCGCEWRDNQDGTMSLYSANDHSCNVCENLPLLAMPKVRDGDEKLLAYLWNNKHSTPFEMGGMIIEVKAPIFVFREWQRHRTQSFNEMSARYIPLPYENYVPSVDRLMTGAGSSTTNKQAQGSGRVLTTEEAVLWRQQLCELYAQAQSVYETGIGLGIPKELARLPVPVARYSRMRASANLRNWLAFLTLRKADAAQWEIRQYADAVGDLVAEHFPRTWALFENERLHGIGK